VNVVLPWWQRFLLGSQNGSCTRCGATIAKPYWETHLRWHEDFDGPLKTPEDARKCVQEVCKWPNRVRQ
jgi:hypothetical protein